MYQLYLEALQRQLNFLLCVDGGIVRIEWNSLPNLTLEHSVYWQEISKMRERIFNPHEHYNINFNTMTDDYEYFLSYRENLLLPIQMHLSKKPKTFCSIFIALFESTLNFEHYEYIYIYIYIA